MIRKIFTRNEESYEIIGEIETIDQLKNIIQKEIKKGTKPQDIMVTDGHGLTFKLLNDGTYSPGT